MNKEIKILEASQVNKFKNKLDILPVFAPNYQKNINYNFDYYKVEACEFYQQMLPNNFNMTKVFGYRGLCINQETNVLEYMQHSPGPAFDVIRDNAIKVEWNNRILGTHMFSIDSTLNWANPNKLYPETKYVRYPFGNYISQYPVPMVTHLHGGEVAPVFDGNPNAWFTSNGLKGPLYETNITEYLNTQQQATLMYHDHSKGIVRLNVYAGMLGPYIIRESVVDKNISNNVNLPSGKYDVVLIIQDKTFYDDGSLYYPSEGINTAEHPYWVNQFYGNIACVNGKVWPNMDVEDCVYRFRIINGSNTRSYKIYMSDKSKFIQIGTDGGLVESPRSLDYFIISPTERIEVLIDFSKYNDGDKIILKNDYIIDDSINIFDVMQFTVKKVSINNMYNVPNVLNFIPKLIPNQPQYYSTLHKEFGIKYRPSQNAAKGMLIDGQPYINPPSDYFYLGSTFEWSFINLTNELHPMHVHLMQFQILYRQKIDVATYLKEWTKVNGALPMNSPTMKIIPDKFLIGPRLAPQLFEIGWKDTIQAPAGYLTKIIIRIAPTSVNNMSINLGENLFPFNPSEAPFYVYHCHIFEHEDNDMMRPMIII